MGAFCGKMLRDLGMDVIKLEPPGGDLARWEPPFAKDRENGEGSLRFAYLNAGKRSVTLDITQELGRKAFLELVGRSDVVLESFEPGYLEAHDLGYHDLIEKQKKLILVSVSGFGQEGPYAHYKTPDIVGNAMGGLLYISGDPAMKPCNPPETQSYYYASLFACYGVMLALWQRETRGIGAWIDTSIQASMALHEHVAFNYSAEGRVMKRAGSQHQHNAPANLFQCKNGWIALFVTQNHWPLLLRIWNDHDPALERAGRRRVAAQTGPLWWLFDPTRPTAGAITVLQSAHGLRVTDACVDYPNPLGPARLCRLQRVATVAPACPG
jgi:benzylsuccinate CoA-transferase BbsE subunit